MSVTITVYLSNVCHYRRIFVQCLSLSAYICPTLVIIGVHLSPPVRNHRKRYTSMCFSMIWNSCPDLLDLPDLPEVSHLLRFGTSSTRPGGQGDMSSNKLPQTIICGHICQSMYLAKSLDTLSMHDDKLHTKCQQASQDH